MEALDMAVFTGEIVFAFVHALILQGQSAVHLVATAANSMG
jgi:hypothetical protein